MSDNQMTMPNGWSGPGLRWLMTAAILTAGGFALVFSAVAGEIKDPPRWTSKDFPSLKDWNLKAENIVPHGTSPLYYPIVPGHKHIHERRDHKDGYYVKETAVLSNTEDFDVPNIGKFRTAVVQEEEYYDGVLKQRALKWLALDSVTKNVYSFGQVNWQINDGDKAAFASTWRAGDPDGDGVVEPGLLMPGTFTVGERYIFAGSRSVAYGGSENMEANVEAKVPAGTFKGCVRVREQGLLDVNDITDKVWCPVVGLVSDTSRGTLVVSNALPKGDPSSDVSAFGKPRDKSLKKKPPVAPVAKISKEQATKIALERMPGKVSSVKIERKLGKSVFAVEIQTASQGEKDVFVDVESGKIVGVD